MIEDMELVEEKVYILIYQPVYEYIYMYTCVNKPIFESTLLCTSVRLYENEKRRRRIWKEMEEGEKSKEEDKMEEEEGGGRRGQKNER